MQRRRTPLDSCETTEWVEEPFLRRCLAVFCHPSSVFFEYFYSILISFFSHVIIAKVPS